ncbi:MAG TPA: hypothetical protein VF092_27055 [Longimicrobium sp.]
MNRPQGFTLLAVILGFMIWNPVRAIIFPPALVGGGAMVRMALEVLIVALMAISIEALWRVRPWAARAVGTLCAATVLKYLVGIDIRQSPAMVSMEAAAVVLLAAVLAIPATYVHARTGAIHGRRSLRRRPAAGRVP